MCLPLWLVAAATGAPGLSSRRDRNLAIDFIPGSANLAPFMSLSVRSWPSANAGTPRVLQRYRCALQSLPCEWWTFAFSFGDWSR